MAKNHDISVYFSTNAIIGLCHALPYLRNSKYACFQLKEAAELESCITAISLVPLMPDED